MGLTVHNCDTHCILQDWTISLLTGWCSLVQQNFEPTRFLPEFGGGIHQPLSVAAVGDYTEGTAGSGCAALGRPLRCCKTCTCIGTTHSHLKHFHWKRVLDLHCALVYLHLCFCRQLTCICSQVCCIGRASSTAHSALAFIWLSTKENIVSAHCAHIC